MISPLSVREIIVALNAYLSQDSNYTNLKIVREEQLFSKLDYPYGSYKILSQAANNREEDSVRYKDDDVANEVSIYSQAYSRMVISINFADKGKTEVIWDLCDKTIQFLKSDEFALIAKSKNLSIQNIGNAIDKTAIVNIEFENKVGFDLLLTGVREYKNTVPSIDIHLSIEEADVSII